MHLITPNVDMAIGGGGRKKWALYLHGVAGIGVALGDNLAGQSFVVPAARLAGGVGAFGRINRRLSIGLLTDVGYAGFGLWIEGMVTLNVHFGRRGQPLTYQR